jgi:hypothetical protein
MSGAKITEFDEELVRHARRFLEAAEAHPESRLVLERYDYSKEEHARGHKLVREAALAFQWEREGKAWNFLSPTPERRVMEARAWFAENLRRHAQSSFRAADAAIGFSGEGPASKWPLSRKLTVGLALALREAAVAFSPRFFLDQRAQLARNLERARGDRPAGAPPPKDTVIVELRGWYERWHLLAHRVFRGRNDLLSPFGLISGKAPPRLRGKAAKAKYGEQAASGLAGAAPTVDADDGEGDAEVEAPARAAPPQKPENAKSLPVIR